MDPPGVLLFSPDLACRTCQKYDVPLKRCASCMDPNILYCSKGCQLSDWRKRHKVECKTQLSLILSAIEVGLFGTTPLVCSDQDRFKNVMLAVTTRPLPPFGETPLAEMVSDLLTRFVYMPPVVEIPTSRGPRFVAFAPFRCYGVHVTREQAMVAITPYVFAQQRGGRLLFTPSPGVLASDILLDESNPPPVLLYTDWISLAPVIANHLCPVAPGEAGTAADVHRARAVTLLPRSQRQLFDCRPIYIADSKAAAGSANAFDVAILQGVMTAASEVCSGPVVYSVQVTLVETPPSAGATTDPAIRVKLVSSSSETL